MPSPTFDLGELLTLSARPVVAQALARGHRFYFDYVGSPTDVAGNAPAFQRCFYRVMCAAMDLLAEGTLILVGVAEQVPGENRVSLRLDATATGTLVPQEAVDAVLARLWIEHADAATEDEARCPYTGARLTAARESTAAASIRATMDLPGRIRDEPSPQVHGAVACLVHEDVTAADGLAGRFRRLGWDCQTLRSCDELLRFSRSDLFEAPSLVIVFETPSTQDAQVQALKAAWPAHPQVLFAVAAGSSAIGGLLPDDTVRVLPLLPSELWDLSAPHTDQDASASRPIPLVPPSVPLVLVVDDNEVNLVIAEGLLRLLGYDTCTARDGAEAVLVCGERNPALVLMDIDLPVLDGYGATALIKEAQRTGAMSSFPVIAVTAGGTPEEAAAHGLDAHLPKPLMMGRLKLAVERALKGLAPGGL